MFKSNLDKVERPHLKQASMGTNAKTPCHGRLEPVQESSLRGRKTQLSFTDDMNQQDGYVGEDT